MNDHCLTTLAEAWEPYRPCPEAPWNLARAAHLHRRAGFSATWGQLDRDLKDGYDESMRRVLEGEDAGPGGQPASEFAATIAAMEESAGRRPSMNACRCSCFTGSSSAVSSNRGDDTCLARPLRHQPGQGNSPELMLAQNNVLRTRWRAPISKLHHRMSPTPPSPLARRP